MIIFAEKKYLMEVIAFVMVILIANSAVFIILFISLFRMEAKEKKFCESMEYNDPLNVFYRLLEKKRNLSGFCAISKDYYIKKYLDYYQLDTDLSLDLFNSVLETAINDIKEDINLLENQQ